MHTCPDESLPYLELARQGARMERSLTADALPRLAEVAPGRGDLRVEMQFSLDADARPWVRGVVRATVAATCQRCLDQFDQPMEAAFALCIVADAAVASELAETFDVLVAGSDTVTVAEVLEDELLLALPERLCREAPCPHAPALSYPAPDAPEPEPEDNPFHVLSALKR